MRFNFLNLVISFNKVNLVRNRLFIFWLGLTLGIQFNLLLYNTVLKTLDFNDELEEIASNITVQVESGNSKGSGFLVRKKGSVYRVVTNNHVVQGNREYQIITHDLARYSARRIYFTNQGKLADDLAILEFETSNKDYKIAKLSTRPYKVGTKVYAAGISATGFLFSFGRIKSLTSQPLQGGYRLGHLIRIPPGASGGALLNLNGEVLGINGMVKTRFGKVDYEYQDGSKPEDNDEISKYSWSIPITSLPKIFIQGGDMNYTRYSRPLNITTFFPLIIFMPFLLLNGCKISRNTEIIEEDQIESTVVRIQSERKGEWYDKGTGVFISESNNEYYILTAAHVIQGRSRVPYRVITNKERVYSAETVWTARKYVLDHCLDFAVLKIEPKEKYRLPKIDSNITAGEEIILAGWSNESTSDISFIEGKITDPRFLNEQPSLDKERGIVSCNVMLYSLLNPAQEGMSGSPIFNKEFELIGIHIADKNWSVGYKGTPSYVMLDNLCLVIDLICESNIDYQNNEGSERSDDLFGYFDESLRFDKD